MTDFEFRIQVIKDRILDFVGTSPMERADATWLLEQLDLARQCIASGRAVLIASPDGHQFPGVTDWLRASGELLGVKP